jgi:hypothetical protein
LPAIVHDSGLRWSCPTAHAVVTADPPPSDALAAAGLLRRELELPPGGTRSVELRVRPDGAEPIRVMGRGAASPFAPARAAGDDPRVGALLRTCVEDLQALLVRDTGTRPTRTSRRGLPGGAAWRRRRRSRRPGWRCRWAPVSPRAPYGPSPALNSPALNSPVRDRGPA